MIGFDCTWCKTPLNADAGRAGHFVVCTRCGRRTKIPGGTVDILRAAAEMKATEDVLDRDKLLERFQGRLPDEVAELGEHRLLASCARVSVFWPLLSVPVVLAAGVLMYAVTDFLVKGDPRLHVMLGAVPCWGVAFLISLGAVVGFVRLLRTSLQTQDCTLLACAGGLACWLRGEVWVVRWEEIREYWQDMTVRRLFLGGFLDPRPGRLYHFRLVLSDGRELKLPPELSSLKEFGLMLERVTLGHLYPPAREEFRAGRSVAFGAVLAVEAEGVVCRRNLLTWSELDEVLVKGGNVELMLRGQDQPWNTVPLRDVPNVGVLLELANSQVRAQERD
jgi:hypothetical protein